MRHQNGLPALLLKLQSIAPYILSLLVFPILTIVALRIAGFTMFGTLFNWSSSKDSLTSHESQDRKKLKKRGVNTRDGDARARRKTRAPDDGYYPGLVNMSGTYCFMNSVVQAFASLSHLRPQIGRIYLKAVKFHVETPVVHHLEGLSRELNIPHSSPGAIRPTDLIDTLSVGPDGKSNPLLCSREHQDAQELFQLLSESIKHEAAAVNKECSRDPGLGTVSATSGLSRRKNIRFTVFDGLTANRRSCVVCGYTEAVMLFVFNNLQLPVPQKPNCSIYECLTDYTQLERLTDCICQKCSMLATLNKLVAETEQTKALMMTELKPSASLRNRANKADELRARVKDAIEEGRIEEEIPGLKLEKVYSSESTKQVMIARTPLVLTLHLNRSLHFGGNRVYKNTCEVEFPEILDLSPFITSGQLSTKPDLPISSLHHLRQSAPSAPQSPPSTLYQLSAVVCHFGQHSSGHKICYRRKPRPVSAGTVRFSPPELSCPSECRCELCTHGGPVLVDEYYRPKEGQGWLRISDDSVLEVGFETVASEGSSAFMLFYEKILRPRASTTRQQVIKEPKENAKSKDAQFKEPEPVQSDTRSPNEVSGSRTNDVQPRIVRNISTRRTESPVPQPKPSSQISTSSLMRGGSYYNAQAQQSQPQENGHARMPATTSESWYRSASPPSTTRESRRPSSNSSPHSNSPSRPLPRVPTPTPTPTTTRMPQRLEI